MPQPFWEVHAGEGPFLLLVHGFLSSRSQWLSNLEALQQHCQPVVMELYGHGRSPSPSEPESYHAAAYVEAMDNIRSKLGTTQWYVCGYSLGAALTIRYALTFPERVVGHIFTNSASAFAAPETIRSWTENGPTSANNLRHGGAKAIERIPVHPRHALRLPSRIYNALVADSKLLDVEGIANTLEHTMPGLSVRRELHRNSRPALLVCGRFETGFQPHREFAEKKMPHLTVRERTPDMPSICKERTRLMPPSKRSCSPQADRKRYIVDALVEERAIERVKRPLLRHFIKRYLYPWPSRASQFQCHVFFRDCRSTSNQKLKRCSISSSTTYPTGSRGSADRVHVFRLSVTTTCNNLHRNRSGTNLNLLLAQVCTETDPVIPNIQQRFDPSGNLHFGELGLGRKR